MGFLEVLRERAESGGGLVKRRFKRLESKLAKLSPAKRAKAEERLDAFARTWVEKHTKVKVTAWGEVKDRDWSGFFDNLLKFLTAILPLILPFLI